MAQQAQRLELLVVVVELVVEVAVLVKMGLEAAGVVAQYLFGLGNERLG